MKCWDIVVVFRDTNIQLICSTEELVRLSSKHTASTLDTVHDHSPSAEALVYATPIDWSDPLASLQILRYFDLDAYSEMVLKAVTTIRKWQKQCTLYYILASGLYSTSP